MKNLLLLLFLFISIGNVKADEGMWLLPLIQELNIDSMKAKGFLLEADDIYNPLNPSMKDAIAMFGGICSSELISPDGLLLTNHHCGYEYIQKLSTIQNNFLEDGFRTDSIGGELSCKGLSVSFLVRFEDVTDTIFSEINDTLDEMARRAIIQEMIDNIEKAAKTNPNYTVEVMDFFGGNKYFLIVYEEYKDVRLVLAPPNSLGKFGGDIDNWMWPRHTADFSIFRVYTSPDGKSAEYSKDNIPMKSKMYFPVSKKGVKKDDFSMVIGFPGSTDRYITSFELEEMLTITHPNRIKIRTLRQDIMEKHMNNNDTVKLKYMAKFSHSSNYWKFSIGQTKWINKYNLVQAKREQETTFQNWLKTDVSLAGKYSTVLPKIHDAVNKRGNLYHSRQYINECIFRSCEILDIAGRTINLFNLLADPNSNNIEVTNEVEKLREYQKEFYENYDLTTDKEITQEMLALYFKDVDPVYHPTIYNIISKKYKLDFEKYAEMLFEKSIFCNKAKYNEFLNEPTLNEIQKDPAFTLAISFYEKYSMIWDEVDLINYDYEKGVRLYIEGLLKMDTTKVYYPDANFTTRMSYGQVRDYYPQDGVHYHYLTTSDGFYEKYDTTNTEFNLPSDFFKVLETPYNDKYRINDGRLPVNFITTNDITGGNSGSAVINGNGELIGCAFDGNWESMSSDIQYMIEKQRAIAVDARFILFFIEYYAKANYLLDEIKIAE